MKSKEKEVSSKTTTTKKKILGKTRRLLKGKYILPIVIN